VAAGSQLAGCPRLPALLLSQAWTGALAFRVSRCCHGVALLPGFVPRSPTVGVFGRQPGELAAVAVTV
jgi:hypothetical protein